MVEATITYSKGSVTVEDFEAIKTIDSAAYDHPNLVVWYTEPNVFEDDASWELYHDASVDEVDATGP